MEKALFKNIFLHKIFICQMIFKIFVALFKTFGMQNGDILIFFVRSFRKVRFRKMQFLKDGVQTVNLSLIVYIVLLQYFKEISIICIGNTAGNHVIRNVYDMCKL